MISATVRKGRDYFRPRKVDPNNIAKAFEPQYLAWGLPGAYLAVGILTIGAAGVMKLWGWW